jgi:hypothetical protein
MDVTTINSKDYYLAADLQRCNQDFFHGCSRGVRLVIAKRSIPAAAYIYATKTSAGWKLYGPENRKANLYIAAEWARENIPKFSTGQTGQVEQADMAAVTRVDQPLPATVDMINKVVAKTYEDVPAILTLEDHERFRDGSRTLDIETRGERHADNIYFKVKDVAAGFGMEHLATTLLHADRGYVEGEDYKTFSVVALLNEQRQVKRPRMYLTYSGMLKVLFSSRSGKAKSFMQWATKTLFTVQMGTAKSKDKLVAKLKGVSYDAIQELFSTNACSTPCVYLTALGSVEALRASMNLPESYAADSIVYKFGLTRDFEQRKNGHTAEYKDLPVDLKLVSFAYIDPMYLSKAEIALAEKLADHRVEYREYKELVVLDRVGLAHARNAVELIGMKFAGHTQEFRDTIARLTAEVEHLRAECERIRADAARETATALAMKDLTCKHELELLRRDHRAELAEVKLAALEKAFAHIRA